MDNFNPLWSIKVAADDVESLRRCDVYRVLSWAPPERREEVAAYITERRPELADEVVSSLSDISEE